MTFSARNLSFILFFIPFAYALAAEPGTTAPASKPVPSVQQARLIEGYGKLALSFEANQGQTDPQVKFLSRGDGYSLFLTSADAVLSFHGKSCSQPAKPLAMDRATEKSAPCVPSPDAVLRMTLVGSNPSPQIEGQDELPGKSNYFIGSDTSAWRTDIGTYGKVHYRDIYPGVDLVYYGNQRELEHDFIVAPGADPNAIRLSFTGAQKMSIQPGGALELVTAGGSVKISRPTIYQEIAGVREEIHGEFIRREANDIGFALGKYDKTQPLVIDPVLVYSTYFGGTGSSQTFGIAADAAGNTYLTGVTSSSDFPVVDPISGMNNNQQGGFVSKISADGSALIYSTFLGGSSSFPTGIAVDSNGSAYVTGYTSSPTFPVASPYQAKLAGTINAFVTKLSPAGSALAYSTYLGGSGEDTAYGITVDSAGAAYLTGAAGSADFPVTARLSPGSLFITKFNPAGSTLGYSALCGGTAGYGNSFAIAVDPQNEAMITGFTTSTDFPLLNSLYSKLDNYLYGSVFVTKLNAFGSGFIFSTYLGGGVGYGIATNSSGDAFVTGRAQSTDRFATSQALFPSFPASKLPAAFVTRIKAGGLAAVYSTYLGTTEGAGAGIDADAAGNAYVTGYATAGFPIKNAIQPSLNPQAFEAAFLTKLDPAGTNLLYSTYLGGDGNTYAQAMAIDPMGDVFVTGGTESENFPLKNALDTSSNAGDFVAKIADAGQLTITNTVDHAVISPGGDLHYTITVTNTGSSPTSGTLIDHAVRASVQSCQVNTGGTCRFAPKTGNAFVDLSAIGGGESRTISIHEKVFSNAGDYNPVLNDTSIYLGPPVYESAFASAPVTVRETADISISSTLADSTNGVLHYVHSVTNLGPDNAHAVLLLDPLPAHTVFISASTTLGECSLHPTIGSYGSVRCTLNNPAAGSTVRVDVVLQAFAGACPTVTNTASVTSQSIDTDSGNDSANVVLQLPQSLCNPAPPPLPKYTVSVFNFNDFRWGARYLNNNGDLVGFFPNNDSNYYIYKNGDSRPTALPFFASGLNDLGDVIGSTYDYKTGVSQGVLYKNGHTQKLDLGPQFPSAFPLRLNNFDQIAGVTSNMTVSSAFIYQNGAALDLGHFPGGSYLQIAGLNNKGEVTGTGNGSYGTQAYLYTHGLLLDAAPNAAGSYAYGVDSSGRVTGFFAPKGTNSAQIFLYSGGKFHNLGPGPDGFGVASAINDCGELVGNSNYKAFLYRQGGFAVLDQLFSFPAGLFVPIAINNHGEILGTVSGSGAQGPAVALLTPLVPEKCGSDATVDNTPDSAVIAAGGNITYTIKVSNLDTETSQFTVADELDPTTALVSCSVKGGGGSCASGMGSQTIAVVLPGLAKGGSAIITIQVKAGSTYKAGSVIMNTATLSSLQTADYLSTAYTSVP